MGTCDMYTHVHVTVHMQFPNYDNNPFIVMTKLGIVK